MRARRKAKTNQVTLNKSQQLRNNETELDNWAVIKKHPVTKVALIVGVTIGLLYVSSYILDAAAKAAGSLYNFKQAIKR